MPRKFYRRSKKSYKPRFSMSQKRMYYIAKKAANKVVRKNLETKFIEVTFSQYVNSNGFGGLTPFSFGMNQITYPSQGTGNNQRTGNRIRLSSFRMNWFFNASVDNLPLRLIVFQWLDQIDSGSTDNDVPDINDVLTPITDGSVNNFQALYNKDASFRYRILYDKILNTGDRKTLVSQVLITKFAQREVQFSDNGNEVLPRIYFTFINTSTPGAEAQGQPVSGHYRLNYTDA